MKITRRQIRNLMNEAAADVVSSPVEKQVAKKVAQNVSKQLLKRAALKAIPVIGWLSLANDIYDLSRYAYKKYGEDDRKRNIEKIERDYSIEFDLNVKRDYIEDGDVDAFEAALKDLNLKDPLTSEPLIPRDETEDEDDEESEEDNKFVNFFAFNVVKSNIPYTGYPQDGDELTAVYTMILPVPKEWNSDPGSRCLSWLNSIKCLGPHSHPHSSEGSASIKVPSGKTINLGRENFPWWSADRSGAMIGGTDDYYSRHWRRDLLARRSTGLEPDFVLIVAENGYRISRSDHIGRTKIGEGPRDAYDLAEEIADGFRLKGMAARALKMAFDHLPENVIVYDFRDDSVHQIVEDEDAFNDAKEGKSNLCKIYFEPQRRRSWDDWGSGAVYVDRAVFVGYDDNYNIGIGHIAGSRR